MHVTTEKIYSIIRESGTASPAYLAQETGLGRAMLHRHLKRLHEQGFIEKLGKPPRVVYQAAQSNQQRSQTTVEKIDPSNQQLIDQIYAYVTATGHIKKGCEGFVEWAEKTNQSANLESLAEEYCALQTELAKFRSL